MRSTLFISTSSSGSSINFDVMKQVLQLWNKPFIDFSEYAYNIPLLVKSFEESSMNIPPKIEEIYKKLEKYDKLVIFTPEHNSSLPAFFKNIIDWLSLLNRNFLKNKDVVVVSVSRTSRRFRLMENGVKNIFEQFSPSSFVFINFNKYSKNIQPFRYEQLLRQII